MGLPGHGHPLMKGVRDSLKDPETGHLKKGNPCFNAFGRIPAPGSIESGIAFFQRSRENPSCSLNRSN
ncbi:MAG: hypothetical protein ABWY16_05015 [Pedobacter sp.]